MFQQRVFLCSNKLSDILCVDLQNKEIRPSVNTPSIALSVFCIY